MSSNIFSVLTFGFALAKRIRLYAQFIIKLIATSNQKEIKDLIYRSGLFEIEYYVRGLEKKGISIPASWALSFYACMSRTIVNDPNRLFDEEYYLRSNTDVAKSDLPAFFHYLKFGHSENRNPHLTIDTRFIASQCNSGDYALSIIKNCADNNLVTHPLLIDGTSCRLITYQLMVAEATNYRMEKQFLQNGLAALPPSIIDDINECSRFCKDIPRTADIRHKSSVLRRYFLNDIDYMIFNYLIAAIDISTVTKVVFLGDRGITHIDELLAPHMTLCQNSIVICDRHYLIKIVDSLPQTNHHAIFLNNAALHIENSKIINVMARYLALMHEIKISSLGSELGDLLNDNYGTILEIDILL